MQHTLHRHYQIPDLNFRDFWDICSHYQRVQPKYQQILYTVEGFGMKIVENEADVAVVLQKIASDRNQVRQYTARYYLSPHSEPGDYGNAKIMYLPATADFLAPGLHFFSEEDNKLQIYNFEDFIFNSYQLIDDIEPEVEYGLPCEILAAVVDVRGFSSFCEQPNIESPYTCGIMTAFYSMIRQCFKRYPPEVVKFLGDGVLAVWQTSAKDREVAIETCIEGLTDIPRAWHRITKGPEFSHGAPQGVGSGVSFGLASKISIGNDYIGRPINIASRMCGVCPPDKTYLDRAVPGIGGFGVKQTTIRLKSYGDQRVWMMDNS